jgi:hypothetical protein
MKALIEHWGATCYYIEYTYVFFFETVAFYLKYLVIAPLKIVASPEGTLVAINYQYCNLKVII